MGDEWHVVGASGRPKAKRAASSKQAAATASVSMTASSGNQGALPGWGSSTTPASHDEPPQALPEGAAAAAYTSSSHNSNNSSSRRGSSRRHELRAPRTLEEQVEALHRQVEQCRLEVARSDFYRALKAAFTSTSTHQLLPGTCTYSSHPAHTHGPSQPGDLGPAAAPAIIDLTTTPQQLQGGSHSHAPTNTHFTTSAVVSQPPAPCCPATSNSGGVAALDVITPWPLCVGQLVVYGLGSVQESRNSRYQLALSLLLCSELLPSLSLPSEVYDPLLTPVDQALLVRLGWRVLEEDEQCARRATRPTFFYLPHLEGHLCDKLLSANLGHAAGQDMPMEDVVSASTLGQCVLLANSFSTYQQRWDMWGGSSKAARSSGAPAQPRSGQQQQQQQQQQGCGHQHHHHDGRGEEEGRAAAGGRPQRPDIMLRLIAAGAVLEAQVPQEASFPAPSAFNDTSLHLFHAHAVTRYLQPRAPLN